MARSANAVLAATAYNTLVADHEWSKTDAWKGIAKLLLTCDVWKEGWRDFHDVIVYRESNDFKSTKAGGPNAYLRKAENLTAFLAQEFGVARSDLCKEVGLYWRVPQLLNVQPHNPVGHAFRSLCVEFLRTFGDPEISYEEEVSPFQLFQGHTFSTRSKAPKLDIVAFRGDRFVAIISTRWRFRHDRVDVVEEALAYSPPARRINPNCELYATVGEFAKARLLKIIENCPPIHKHPALNACVHFAPQLILNGLGENGDLKYLQSLEWLSDQTWSWN